MTKEVETELKVVNSKLSSLDSHYKIVKTDGTLSPFSLIKNNGNDNYIDFIAAIWKDGMASMDRIGMKPLEMNLIAEFMNFLKKQSDEVDE